MSGALALQWRPRRFSDVAGQTPVTAVLYRMAYYGDVPDAILMEGNRGSGKTSTARILASALNCETERGPVHEWPCTSCASCLAIAGTSSLDVLEIDAASNGTVDKIREIKDQLNYQATGRKHVVVLDEAHSMSGPAGNQLLKTLEEPPPDTVFVLITTESHRILPTVVSRCMVFTFRRLTVPVITSRLQQICEQHGFAAEHLMLVRIAERADGAMRDAVMLLDQLMRVGITDMARYQVLMRETDFAPDLVERMACGDHAGLLCRLDEVLAENADYGYISAQIVDCLTSILRLQGGGPVSWEGEGLERRSALARTLDKARVAGALRVLWDLRVRGGKGNPRAMLELAVTMCLEKLAVPAQAAPMLAPVNGHAVMTAQQLQQMA